MAMAMVMVIQDARQSRKSDRMLCRIIKTAEYYSIINDRRMIAALQEHKAEEYISKDDKRMNADRMRRD